MHLFRFCCGICLNFFLHSAYNKVACPEPAGPHLEIQAMANMLQQILTPVVQTLTGRAGQQQEDPVKLTFLNAGQPGQMPVSNTAAGQLQLTNSQAAPAPATTSAAVPLQTSMPAEPSDSAAGKQDETPAAGSKPSLMEFEEEAYRQLQNKKAGVLRKPAAAKAAASKTPAGGKTKKGNVKPATSKKSTLKLGCLKCRGALLGCVQCRNPAYSGCRLTRAEWVALARERGLKF